MECIASLYDTRKTWTLYFVSNYIYKTYKSHLVKKKKKKMTQSSHALLQFVLSIFILFSLNQFFIHPTSWLLRVRSRLRSWEYENSEINLGNFRYRDNCKIKKAQRLFVLITNSVILIILFLIIREIIENNSQTRGSSDKTSWIADCAF